MKLGKPSSIKRTPLKLILIVGGIILITQVSTFLFAPSPEQDAWGKIILPNESSLVKKEMTVVGETQDIASGQYIWVAIDQIDTGFTRPLQRVLRNSRFRMRFSSDEANPPCFLSLYIVDETTHQVWSDWRALNAGSGVNPPSESRRLHQVRLLPAKP